MRRLGIWIAAFPLAALLFSACLGGGGSDGPGTAISCGPIADADRYRYSLSVKFVTTELQASPGPDTGAVGGAGLDAFGEALAALFSDMRMEGAYVAPDRRQMTLRFKDEEVELRSIGKKAWLRVGDDWQPQDVPAQSLLDPRQLCDELAKEVGPIPRDVKPEAGSVNGVKADRYQLNETTLKDLPEMLGSGEDMPDRFAADIWLARDGRWPVRVRLYASEGEGRQGGELEFVLEFRDLDVEGIKVEAPAVSAQD